MNMKTAAPVNSLRPILAGLMYSFISLGVIALIVSLLLLLSNLNEHSLHFYIYVIHGISLIIGGITTGKRIGMKGWYYGGIMGVSYSIIIHLVGFLGFDSAFHFSSLILIFVSFAMGAFGGMIGVNVKK